MSISVVPSNDTKDARPLKIAVEGCGHGSLDTIYDAVDEACSAKGWAISDLDFLIICGDFQAVRNSLDLNCMSVPRAYREMGDFHKYYSGESIAPVLTLVIGGNHEASNYFFELYHGGWIAPNIYYLGAANVIRYGPYRIAGLSGIFKNSYYRRPHGERLPYSRDGIRSVYHIREYDVRKLLQIQTQIEIGLSHDWPAGVEMFGEYDNLFARYPNFLESAKNDDLGSKPAAMVMNHFRPGHWFAGHMHTRYSATVTHTGERLDDSIKNLVISDKMRAELPILRARPRTPPNTKRTPPLPAGVTNTKTEFLALSKVGTDNQFLELKEITFCSRVTSIDEASYRQKNEHGKFFLQYDVEWLAIIRAFDDGLMIKDSSTGNIVQGKPEKGCVANLSKNMKWVQENIVDKDLLRVPNNFVIHAPVYDTEEEPAEHQQPIEYENSQTAHFYEMLQIPNKFAIKEKKN